MTIENNIRMIFSSELYFLNSLKIIEKFKDVQNKKRNSIFSSLNNDQFFTNLFHPNVNTTPTSLRF